MIDSMIDSLIGSASQNWVDSTSHYWEHSKYQ
nr:MAG TPA_asm: hypothetical protein [Caudoviricetes sp.]